jgi:RNA polymerase sigma factor (sigma-70 family)
MEGSRLPRDKKAILQELLVLRCKRGDNQAFNELVSQWEERLFYYVRRLVGTEEDAWDVLQQTWLKVFKGIKSLNDPQRLPIWLYQIARCGALSHWRGHYRSHAFMEDNSDLTELAASEENCHFDDAEQVHRALGRISLLHREVLTLYFLEDLSLDQMAEVLAIPAGTIKSRLYYAKQALRAVIQREEGGYE